MKITELIGLLDPTKASIEIRKNDNIHISFHMKRGRGMTCCVRFLISDHGSHVEITHVESMCLPGRDWSKCLEAYHRAHLFCESLKKYLQKQGKQLKEV